MCYSGFIVAKFKENSTVDAACTLRPILRVDNFIQCDTKIPSRFTSVAPILLFFEIVLNVYTYTSKV